VTRDLAPGRLRPTGLALALLNGAIDGDAHAALCSGNAAACENVTAAWFRRPRKLQLAVASRDTRPLRIRTGIACNRPVQIRLLDGSDPRRNNETEERVRIEQAKATCDAEWVFDLPAHSVAVLRTAIADAGARR